MLLLMKLIKSLMLKAWRFLLRFLLEPMSGLWVLFRWAKLLLRTEWYLKAWP